MGAVLIGGGLIEILSPIGALHAAAAITALAPLAIIGGIGLIEEWAPASTWKPCANACTRC